MGDPFADSRHYLGRQVRNTAGTRLGRIEDVLLDARTRSPEWLVIRLPGLRRRHRGAPLLLAMEEYEGLVLPLTEETLRSSPRISWRAHLTTVQERALRRYWMDH